MMYVHVHRICSVFLATQATLIYIANFGKYCATDRPTACELHKGMQNMLLLGREGAKEEEAMLVGAKMEGFL